MSGYQHLEPEVAEYLEMPKPERIAFCQSDRWVGYTRAMEVLSLLDDLVTYPKTIRMPNVLIVGRAGNGKSSIIQRFTSRHPIEMTPTGSPIAPILRIELPETPNESELWSTILWALTISHRFRDSAASKRQQAIAILRYAAVKILVIDEFNNLANAGKGAGDLLAAIKGLCNELKLSVVAAGTQAAIHVLDSEPQMKTRFEPAPLDVWHLDKEYLRFLGSYERLLPLPQPSGLATREMAPVIFGMAGNTVGGTVKLLKTAAKRAIESNAPCITPKLLEGLAWTAPGDWSTIAQRV